MSEREGGDGHSNRTTYILVGEADGTIAEGVRLPCRRVQRRFKLGRDRSRSTLWDVERMARRSEWVGQSGGIGRPQRGRGECVCGVFAGAFACRVTTSSGRRTFTRAAVASLAANCEISGGGPFWMRPFLFLPTWRYDTRMAEPPRPSIEAATDRTAMK